jgi:hypothetical protein
MILEILDNGNLKLIIDEDDKEFIHDMRYTDEIRDEEDMMYQLLEEYSCNGSYAIFNAGNANPFVGLTDAPCIAEQLDYQDNGDIDIVGKYWYYADYMVTSYISELEENGHVIFTYGGE